MNKIIKLLIFVGISSCLSTAQADFAAKVTVTNLTYNAPEQRCNAIVQYETGDAESEYAPGYPREDNVKYWDQTFKVSSDLCQRLMVGAINARLFNDDENISRARYVMVTTNGEEEIWDAKLVSK